MSAALAHGSWLRPQRPTTAALGREIVLTSQPGTPRALQWLLTRGGTDRPRQMRGVYFALCLLTLAMTGFFSWRGARAATAIGGLGLAAVAAAVHFRARHAGDRETLTLVGRSLAVEQCFGSHVQRTDFAAEWLTVEPAAGQGSLIELSGRGQTVRVGRLLKPELRPAFARELRQALRPPIARDLPQPGPI